jgi:nucleoside-diphosphate-sugar epimerase
VTGGGGFIGRHVVAALAREPLAELRVLARRPAALASFDDHKVRVIQADVTSEDGLDAAVAGVDVIVHLAGLTRAHTLAELRRVNAEGTRRLARAAVRCAPALDRFLLVSSQAAAGPAGPGEIVGEERPERPVTHYGRSKLEGERALREVLPRERWTILRPPAVFGPHERDILTVFKMVQSGVAPVLGRGTKWFSYVYGPDLAGAIVRAAALPACAGELYFAAAAEPLSNDAFMQAIERALGRSAWKPRIPHALAALAGLASTVAGRFAKRPPLLTLQRYMEIRCERWVCDSSKLERAIGSWSTTPLDLALSETVRWYRQTGWL